MNDPIYVFIYFSDKKSTTALYNRELGLMPTQVSQVSAAGISKPVTKQTVILTYQPQQFSQVCYLRITRFHTALLE